ncbi:hypothetical protein EPN83_00705 [Patescibacteria group bacterium]|nr:MAG: hypothetical protein EPN83_00705 [Patescibacteria group bacterium]
MAKHRLVFGIGVVLMFLPFTGFPSSWKWFFVFLSGAGLIAISIHTSVRRRLSTRRRRLGASSREETSFVEHDGSQSAAPPSITETADGANVREAQ